MVHDCGKNKCTTYIKERMLFDKHRCQNDADRQNQCQETDQLVFAQLFIVCHRKINAERIIYMDTREQIRRSIRLVQHFTKLREDVVMREIVWTQIVSVRIDR